MSDYYRAEWAIALDPSDPRHCYPERSAVRTLDVGCGCGSPVLGPNVTGIDLSLDAMRFGRAMGAPHRFAAASGEQLPFRDASFDRVVARVSLPYMHVRTAMGEFARVLRPHGALWISLHPFALGLRWLRESRGKAIARRAFVLANGALLHLTGTQLRGWTETVQTDRAIRRALARAGFADVRITRGRHYVVEATRVPHVLTTPG